MRGEEPTPRAGRSDEVLVAAVAVLAVLAVLAVTAGVVTAAGSTTVSIAPRTGGVEVGETTSFEVVVEDADGGVGSAAVEVVVDDPDIAGITNVTVPGTGAEKIDIAPDGSSADVRYVFRDTADTGTVRIIEVTVEGRARGETGLSLEATEGNDDVLVFDEKGTGYNVTGTAGATLAVRANGTTAGGSSGSDGSTAGGGSGSDGSDGAGGEVEIVEGSLLNETVTAGNWAVARVDLRNDGPVRGTVVLNLATNGSVVAERSVAVGASTDRTVFVRYRFDRTGNYDVSVNGVSLGVVRVTADTTPTSTATITPMLTDGPTTATPTATTDGTVTPTASERPGTTGDGEESRTARDGPGFGLLVATLSVLGSGLLLRRI